MCEIASATGDVFPDFYGSDGELHADSDRSALNPIDISGKELGRLYQTMYVI